MNYELVDVRAGRCGKVDELPAEPPLMVEAVAGHLIR